ncbi:MAG: hypothetical protein J6R20_01930 [Clostridia bacterium]|nr:hypothetical protein [Clostridia bacterium]
MMYGFLAVSALLFALQFLFNQQYQKISGDGTNSAVTLSLYLHGISFFLMFVLNGFKLDFTWFSILMAALYAAVVLGYSFSSLKAFKTANLSVFSIFAMLGGMLLPLAYGVIFRNEGFPLTKIICVVLIGVATAMSFEKGKKTKGSLKYYLAVFVLNGLVGVISTIHQTKPELAVDSRSFMATVNICVVIACVVYQLTVNKKITIVSPKEFGYLAGYAGCNGIGNLLCLIALTNLPASVQFPIVTGGTMFFSTAVSIIRKEKPSARTVIASLIAFAATVLMMF